MYKPTKERIAELKAEHGDLFLITVEDKQAIFKAPSRKTLSYANASNKDIVKFNETILNGCFVEGDRELLDDDRYFLAAGSKAIELIEIKESEIAKL
jgi:hypothetical protein